MKPKQQEYYCKRCGTVETITEQDGIKLKDLTKVICPICKSKKKGHSYKMYKVKEDNTIINTKEEKTQWKIKH